MNICRGQDTPTPGCYISKTARVSGVQFSFLNNTGHTKRYSVSLGIMKDHGLILQNRIPKGYQAPCTLWASVQIPSMKYNKSYLQLWLLNSYNWGAHLGYSLNLHNYYPKVRVHAHFNFSAVSFLQGQDGRVTTIA